MKLNIIVTQTDDRTCCRPKHGLHNTRQFGHKGSTAAHRATMPLGALVYLSLAGIPESTAFRCQSGDVGITAHVHA
jgi:hypothetical protein